MNEILKDIKETERVLKTQLKSLKEEYNRSSQRLRTILLIYAELKSRQQDQKSQVQRITDQLYKLSKLKESLI